MLDTPVLLAKLAAYAFSLLGQELSRQWAQKSGHVVAVLTGNAKPVPRNRNIVIVGASYAGFEATRRLLSGLPTNTPFRIIVIEPNSHFQFTWVIPRFSVTKGHEHKAYIPYGGLVNRAPQDAVRLVQDRAVGLTETHVQLQNSKEEIPYEYLIVATGFTVEGLPSKPNETEKLEAMKKMRTMQNTVQAAKNIVVVGGGAVGVEFATDAKSLYPDKQVTLVHSRSALLHRFGTKIQKAAMDAFTKMGGELILEERVVSEDKAAGTVTLRSGRVIECDFFVNCTGQKPASDIIKILDPGSISDSGHIKVKPTLQLANDAFPNIYACGDVADTNTTAPKAYTAMRQASIVVDNVLLSIRGKQPSQTYESHWSENGVKLTLGLGRSVFYLGDGNREMMFNLKEKEEMMAAEAWRKFGEKPFKDGSFSADALKDANKEEA